MTVLRTKQSTPWPMTLFLGCYGASIVVGLVYQLSAFSGHTSQLVDTIGILVVASAPMLFLLIQNKQLQSVELNEEGISALRFKVHSSFPYCGFAVTQIAWHEVEYVRVGAFHVEIKHKKETIHVNALRFEDPDGVYPFIKACLERSNSSYMDSPPSTTRN